MILDECSTTILYFKMFHWKSLRDNYQDINEKIIIRKWITISVYLFIYTNLYIYHDLYALNINMYSANVHIYTNFLLKY